MQLPAAPLRPVVYLIGCRHFDEFFNLCDKTWAFMNDQDKARLQQRLAEHWPQ
jgi:hypothetical protein